MQQTNSNDPNSRIVTALIGTAVAGLIAVSYPVLIPAITVAGMTFMALAMLLKL